MLTRSHRAGLGVRAGLAWPAATLALALLMLWPAWLNRQPILFPDSIGYERAGVAALSAAHLARDLPVRAATSADPTPGIDRDHDGVSTLRSPYYGIPLVLLLGAGGMTLAVFAQALLLATAAMLLLHRLGVGLRRASAGVALLALVSGVSVFAVVPVPDAFAGIMIAGIAVLLGVERLPAPERLFWLAMVLAATLFHRAFAATAVLMLAAMLLPPLRARLVPGRLVPLAAIVAAALGAHVLVDVAVKRLSGQPPVVVPFLLARYGDSPVLSRYLAEACPSRPYALCRYRDRLPLAPDEFLWGANSVFAGVAPSERRRIADEADTVIRAAIAARPVAALVEAARGVAAQFVTVGMADFALGIPPQTHIDARMVPFMTDYPASRVARHDFPFPLLGALAMAGYLAGLAALTVFALRPPPHRVAPAAASVVLVLVIGLAANAVVAGALSGVFERYQGRLAWLPPLAVLIIWQARRRGVSVPGASG